MKELFCWVLGCIVGALFSWFFTMQSVQKEFNNPERCLNICIDVFEDMGC